MSINTTPYYLEGAIEENQQNQGPVRYVSQTGNMANHQLEYNPQNMIRPITSETSNQISSILVNPNNNKNITISSGENGVTNTNTNTNDDDEDENENENKKSKLAIIFLMEVLVCLGIVIYSVPIFILQWHSNNSMIMMGCGYSAITIAISTLIYVCLSLKYYTQRSFRKKYIKTQNFLIIVIFIICVIQALVIPVVIYRQATENLMTLFNGLSVLIRILLVFSTIIPFFLLFVLCIKLSLTSGFNCFSKKK